MSLLSELEAVFEKYHVEDELFHVGEGILRVANGAVYEDEEVSIKNNSGKSLFLVGVSEDGPWNAFFKAAKLTATIELPQLNVLEGELEYNEANIRT